MNEKESKSNLNLFGFLKPIITVENKYYLFQLVI